MNAFIRRDCPKLRKNELEFCFECNNFPCSNLDKLDKTYQKQYQVSLINNLKRNEEIGTEKWLKEQEKLYTCQDCGGQICLNDEECYDCQKKINPNKKE